MISICGGEPLIYPHIEELVAGLLAQRRIVYICTNGMFMRKKMRGYLAARIRRDALFHCRKLAHLGVGGLRTPAQAREIREAAKPSPRRAIAPSGSLLIGTSISTDSSAPTIASSSVKAFSKNASQPSGWRKFSAIRSRPTRRSTRRPTWTKSERCSTICRGSVLTATQSRRDTTTMPPRKSMRKRLNLQPENFFLTRAMTKEKFKASGPGGKIHHLWNPDLPRFSGGTPRSDLLSMGDPDRNVAVGRVHATS